MGLNQVNLAHILTVVDDWDDWKKRVVIIAVGECGYALEADLDSARFDVEIHEVDTMQDLAEQFVEERLFGDVPEAFQNYIDYGAIAPDLAVEY